MGKIVDITSKLSFEDNPRLMIKGEELEVKTDAKTVLQIIEIYGDGDVSVDDILKMKDCLFTVEATQKLEGLHLSFDDFTTVIKEAMDLAVGNDEDDNPGELQILATTS